MAEMILDQIDLKFKPAVLLLFYLLPELDLRRFLLQSITKNNRSACLAPVFNLSLSKLCKNYINFVE